MNADRPIHGLHRVRLTLSGGRHIALEAAGQGPALLLLHGVGGHRGQWRRQTLALADAFCVIAWDARNYGGSTGPEVTRFADFSDDLLAVLDALGLRSVLAAGHSMGGRILIETALAAPERFAGLVLSGAQPAYLEHMTDEGRRAYVEKRAAMFEGGAVRPETAARISAEVLPAHATSGQFAELAESFRRLRPEGYLAALAASAGWNRAGDVARLRLPAAVLGGALDPICPPSECHRLAEGLGHGPATILPDVGHMAQIEAPEVVTAFLRQRLAPHAGGADSFEAARLPLFGDATEGVA